MHRNGLVSTDYPILANTRDNIYIISATTQQCQQIKWARRLMLLILVLCSPFCRESIVELDPADSGSGTQDEVLFQNQGIRILTPSWFR